MGDHDYQSLLSISIQVLVALIQQTRKLAVVHVFGWWEKTSGRKKLRTQRSPLNDLFEQLKGLERMKRLEVVDRKGRLVEERSWKK